MSMRSPELKWAAYCTLCQFSLSLRINPLKSLYECLHLAAAVLETSVYLRRRKATNCSVLYCLFFSNCYPLHVAVVLFLFFVFCSLQVSEVFLCLWTGVEV